MSSSLQINIANPCHEDWEKMTEQDKGRFCGSCQKIVVDFSVMTDQEILDHIARASGGVCARTSADQLNKPMVKLAPKKRATWVYVWNMVLATFLFTKADAQVKPQKMGKVAIKVVRSPKVVGEIMEMPVTVKPPVKPSGTVKVPVTAKGIVIDEASGNALEGASIMNLAKQTGSATGKDGHFEITFAENETIEMVVTMIGYESQTIKVDYRSVLLGLKVALKPEASTMTTVEVRGYPVISCGFQRMGAVIQTVKVDTLEKLKRTLNDLKPSVLKKDVRIFPNPIQRGNDIQVSLSLKQAGEYKLELLNTAGQVMTMQNIQLPDQQRVINIPTQSLWSAGVYWVRISSQQVTNVYNGKVIIR